MKNWEETVKKYQCKHSVIAGSNEWHMIDGYNMGAKAQAEISFNAGYEAHVAEWDEGVLARGKREGIREVVEWGDGKCPHIIDFGDAGTLELPKRACKKCWQAQLKKWGKKK